MTQQRIEQAAEAIAENCISKRTRNHPANQLEKIIIRDACVKMANWALSHQWISVDEELPTVENTYKDEESGIVHKWSKWVLIRTREGGVYLDSYVFHKHIWTNNGEDVTQWMEIPTEGGEE